MLFFTPSSLHNYRQHIRPQPLSSRDKYLAALAEVKSAEVEYVAALQQEEQQAREALRREAVLDAMYAVDRHDACYATYPGSNYGFSYPFAEQRQLAALRAQEERLALARLRQQEEERRRAMILRRQEEDRIRALAASREAKRQEQARLRSLQNELGFRRTMELLLGEAPQQETKPQPRYVPHPRVQKQSQQPQGMGEIMNLLFGQNREESHQQPMPESSAQAPQHITLKEALENRLQKEQETDIRNTLQGLISSIINPPNPPTPLETNIANDVKGKGKGKETEPELLPAEPTSKDVMDSFNTIRDIEAAFFMLESEFTFPAHLDFAPSPIRIYSGSDSESGSSLYNLAYSSTNAPVRYYEHSLSALLTRLDTVESFGNDEVRVKRKELVGRIEKALEEVEREVAGRLSVWKRKQEKSQDVVAVEATPKQVGQAEPSRSVLKSSEPASESSSTSLVENSTSSPASDIATSTDTLLPSNAEDSIPTETPTSLDSEQSSVDNTPENEGPTPMAVEKDSAASPETQSATAAELEVTSDLVSSPSPSLKDNKPVQTDVVVTGTPQPGDTIVENLTAQDMEVDPTVATLEHQQQLHTFDTTPEQTVPQVEIQAEPEAEVIDTFLLPASPAPSTTKDMSSTQTDVEDVVIVDDEHSDWSELDA